jgi:mRNA interferase MazF
MTYQQGDIIKFNFDPTLGHEQSGYRPAIIISNSIFNTNTGQLIVCPITSQKKAFPTRIAITSNIQTKGFIMCDYVKTIDIFARTPKFIEKIDKETLKKTLLIVNTFFDEIK